MAERLRQLETGNQFLQLGFNHVSRFRNIDCACHPALCVQQKNRGGVVKSIATARCFDTLPKNTPVFGQLQNMFRLTGDADDLVTKIRNEIFQSVDRVAFRVKGEIGRASCRERV